MPERPRRAFTLIELMVVVAIIAVLISILLPSLGRAKKQARAVVCKSNLRQLAVGWLSYAAEWNGMLPGTASDTEDQLPDRQNGRHSFCWLGTWYDDMDGWKERFVPKTGTIFPYMGKNVDVYKCPEDRIEQSIGWAERFGDFVNKPLYSYTGPMLLTGAPLALLKETWYGDGFDFVVSERPKKLVRQYSRRSLPWMIVEEDLEHNLVNYMDSAWCASDELTARHSGRGTIAHVDGHVSQIKTQKGDVPLTARQVFYSLTDGRYVAASPWEQWIVYFGYLKDRNRSPGVPTLNE